MKALSLNPANLHAGGIVGTVELVDVIPLDEAAYRESVDAHLAGRRWPERSDAWLQAEGVLSDIGRASGKQSGA